MSSYISVMIVNLFYIILMYFVVLYPFNVHAILPHPGYDMQNNFEYSLMSDGSDFNACRE